MKRPPLAALFRRWQRKLRLLDWDIQVQYVRAWDDGHATRFGLCRCNRDRGEAEIEIFDPRIRAHDVESTLVHELMHVKL